MFIPPIFKPKTHGPFPCTYDLLFSQLPLPETTCKTMVKRGQNHIPTITKLTILFRLHVQEVGSTYFKKQTTDVQICKMECHLISHMYLP